MEQFLLNLTFGISEIPRNKKQIFEELKSLNAIEVKQKSFKLKQEFTIGYIDVVESKNQKIYFLKPLKPSNRDYKILNRIHLCNKDLVIAKVKPQRNKDKRPKATLIKILKRENIKGIGILKNIKNNLRICNLKTGEILQIKASQKSLKTLPLHCLFEIDLTNLKILNLIGTLNDAKNDLSIALLTHNKNEIFSNEIMDFCKSFDSKIDPSYYPNRVDLSSLPFISIDPDDAKDFDDAIYFDGTYLYVAIADVSHYVALDSAIDKEALNRGFSIYFPNKVIPMLPDILSCNLCSLKENKNRLAFVWKIKINKKTMQITQSELFEAIIKVSKNYTYKQFNQIIKQENNIFNKLFKITSKIRKKRLKNGLDFQNNEIKLELDCNDEIASITKYQELDSNHLVEECMLLANKESAKMLENHSGIYRIHDEIDENNLKSLFNDISLLSKKENITFNKKLSQIENIKAIQSIAKKINLSHIIDKIIVTYLPRAQYSTNNKGHFALGFDAYLHFTSPIRRYSDLVTHRILKEIINNNQKKLNYLSKNLDAICARLNFLEKDIANIEFEFNDRKFARFYKVGDVVECIVTQTKDETKAKIIDSNARIFLNKKCQKFSIIKAEITSSDIETSRIEGKILI